MILSGVALGAPRSVALSAPVPLFGVLALDGLTLTVQFSRPVVVGAGGSGGVVATGSTSGAKAGTYVSGAGSVALTFTLAGTIGNGETVAVAYTQPGNGLEGMTGLDVVTFSGVSADNFSMV